MKIKSALAMIICGIAISAFSQTQKSVSPVTQVLQSSLTAMLGKSTVQDVTVSGSAEMISGATNDNGSFEFRALANGSNRTDITLSSATVTETWQLGTSTPAGWWSNGDGTQHPISPHNMFSGASWPFPPLHLLLLLQDSSMTITYLGQEGGLLHFQAFRQPPGASAAMLHSLAGLTRVDLWLDASTFLPARMSFNRHPDNNAALNIPVTVQFSGYQTIGKVVVPSHIQEYINGTLALDLHIQAVNLNTGLPPTDFTAQN